MDILIDNGHGNDTPGKRSPIWSDGTQLFEFEFNRDVAKRLFKLLQINGIDCKMIVPEEIDISLPERVRRINKIYEQEKKCFLVSIHANAGGGSGWEIFTSPGETESDVIADFFVKSAIKNLSKFKLRSDFSDGDADKEARFYMLRKTKCPAVLTENLFMDTERDCRFIMSNYGRNVIAKLHFDAINSYLKNNYDKIIQRKIRCR
ncbi:MAG: N-acetylmuramoyl-L-alanine amidase [Bacteroidetes bacterium]|nr:N-acetylmuramoyl-L-alanine amidase [Bacteroidota bacterium]